MSSAHGSDLGATCTTEYTLLSPGIGLEYDVMALIKGHEKVLRVIATKDKIRSFWEIIPNRDQIVRDSDHPTLYRFDDLVAVEIDEDGHELRQCSGHLTIYTDARNRYQPAGFLTVWSDQDVDQTTDQGDHPA